MHRSGNTLSSAGGGGWLLGQSCNVYCVLAKALSCTPPQRRKPADAHRAAARQSSWQHKQLATYCAFLRASHVNTSKLSPNCVTSCFLQETSEGPTATCLCFVTPDGQRTMRTCLGASAHLSTADQLPAGWCSGAVLVHCEGYCLYRPQLAREALSRAKQAGALVSIDLASFECVQNCSR